MSDTPSVHIRQILPADKPEWRRLWTAYLEFYGSTVSEEVYETTFQRLFEEDPWMPRCFLAVQDERPVGLVHYFYHTHCWRVERVCYLQDLFADPDVRGQGIGRKLIEAVYAQAKADGAPSVYWMTQEHNVQARKLYDRIGTVTPFIKYQGPT